MKTSIFPEWAGRLGGPLSLDALGQAWWREHPETERAANPFLDPAFCQQQVQHAQQAHGWDWSWGGYLEDRRNVWAGSYLDRTGNYLHLGIDLNVPPGTQIAATRPGRVMLVDKDIDQAGGWGNRIFLEPDTDGGPPVLMIYAHITGVRVQPGQTIAVGDVMAVVDAPPTNGNWYPHLHVQIIRKPLFQEILLERFDELDGYGPPGQEGTLRKDYPDPRSYIASPA